MIWIVLLLLFMVGMLIYLYALLASIEERKDDDKRNKR